MKTRELTGAALDWAVAKAEGKEHVVNAPHKYIFEPSTDWARGGPIIEREKLSVVMQQGMPPIWSANCPRALFRSQGPTPLIAAMRCFVASRLGDEVDASSELLEV
jgi:hypothetical protein